MRKRKAGRETQSRTETQSGTGAISNCEVWSDEVSMLVHEWNVGGSNRGEDSRQITCFDWLFGGTELRRDCRIRSIKTRNAVDFGYPEKYLEETGMRLLQIGLKPMHEVCATAPIR